ncbi:MAG: class C sortase [Candidatus Saccharibacteria bacterium]|nr:class C sortase [Candidatus Saccharibacteria bacterium]
MKNLLSAKNRLTTIIFIVSVALGIFLIVAPLVMGKINQAQSDAIIEAYQKAANSDTDKYKKDFERADKYNLAITKTIEDNEITKQYNDILNIRSGIMGYIEIPRISIRDPIYHGVEEDALKHGIGHLPSTSLPTGGKGNHIALSGHRGLPSSKLFTDLDRVREGDIILLKIADRKLAYKVYDIEVVDPDYNDGLKIEPDRDLLTLITCTPYAVNTHRLLVHAERTEYTEEMEGIKKEFTISESDRILLIALGIVAMILALDIVVILKRRKRERAADQDLSQSKPSPK